VYTVSSALAGAWMGYLEGLQVSSARMNPVSYTCALVVLMAGGCDDDPSCQTDSNAPTSERFDERSDIPLGIVAVQRDMTASSIPLRFRYAAVLSPSVISSSSNAHRKHVEHVGEHKLCMYAEISVMWID
jgi:hypothetical protein